MARDPYQLSVIKATATIVMAATAMPAMTSLTGHARTVRGACGMDFSIGSPGKTGPTRQGPGVPAFLRHCDVKRQFFQNVTSICQFWPGRHPWYAGTHVHRRAGCLCAVRHALRRPGTQLAAAWAPIDRMGRNAMQAKSKAQQQAAGIALAAKRGDKKVGELKGASKSMYESMDEKELQELAETETRDKPKHKGN
jgi:hypothetical protein